MKYWKLLGYESEPKGIGKIVSISLFIVLLNGYILEGFIDHYLLDIITWTCVVVFMVIMPCVCVVSVRVPPVHPVASRGLPPGGRGKKKRFDSWVPKKETDCLVAENLHLSGPSLPGANIIYNLVKSTP